MRIVGEMRDHDSASVGLIITTYNRPDALAAVLRSAMTQTVKPHEVVISDDGSSTETALVVQNFKRQLPIKHCWLPDCSFRAARARNLAIAKSTAEYLIFIDGDVLMPKTFIENHLQLGESGKIIAGNRKILSPETTRRILGETNKATANNVFKSTKFRRLWLGIIRDYFWNKLDSVRTCNLSLFRQDAFAVGGFDESFVGWGREDTDFIARSINSGMRIRSGRFAVAGAHLWHKESPRDNLSNNDRKLQMTIRSRSTKPRKSLIVQL